MRHLKIAGFLLAFSLMFLTCEKEPNVIVPTSGYAWPEKSRDYWPTEGWQTAPMIAHHIDPELMALADEFARKDMLSRALLVVKDGYLVFENYYGEGGVNESTNLWSVTKSVTSALVGLLYDQKYFSSMDKPMSDLMPQYEAFENITLHHVLTMTTGLNWEEEGPLWVKWILSDDWVTEALSRGFFTKPGKEFFYSSANSHFLTSLVYYQTDIKPGVFADEYIFEPLGIDFTPENELIQYTSWNQYVQPYPQRWRQDSKGIECASFALHLTARDMAKFGYLYLNRGYWDGKQIISEEWVELSTRDHIYNVYERYSYGYQWYLTIVGGHPAFLASGFGGQIIGVVPDLDLVVVLKYEAENPRDPVTGTTHDDMHLFELVVNAVSE